MSTLTKKRVSAREYAALVGLHEDTIQARCRAGMLVCRRIGGKWEIDVEASEKALSLRFGNATERDLAKRGLLTPLR